MTPATYDVRSSNIVRMKRHHYDLGIVMLPSTGNSSLAPYFRLKGNTNVPVFQSADLAIQPVNSAWLDGEITFEVKQCNTTYYVFSAGPAGKQSQMQDIGFGPALGLTWGFTGKSKVDDLKD